jgi:hypothetical protein
LVNEVASGELAELTKHWLREERHPDRPDKPADVE